MLIDDDPNDPTKKKTQQLLNPQNPQGPANPVGPSPSLPTSAPTPTPAPAPTSAPMPAPLASVGSFAPMSSPAGSALPLAPSDLTNMVSTTLSAPPTGGSSMQTLTPSPALMNTTMAPPAPPAPTAPPPAPVDQWTQLYGDQAAEKRAAYMASRPDADPDQMGAAWSTYSPMSNLTPDQKTAYWQGQGVEFLAPGSTTEKPIILDRGDPAAEQAIYQQVQGQQQSTKDAMNANAEKALDVEALGEIEKSIGNLQSGGGLFSDTMPAGMSISGPAADGMQTRAQYFDAEAQRRGIDPTGRNPYGGTSSMPVVGGTLRDIAPSDRAPTSSTPENPSRPTTPGTTGTTTDTPSGQTGGSSNAQTDITRFDQTNNLRDAQITPGQTKSRGDIAQGYLDAFDKRAEAPLRDKIRAVGQKAASFGRLGMGDTAVEALNPYTDYLKERAALSSELASRSAEGEIGDARSDRGEFRTERDYQGRLNREAIEDAITQWQLQRQARNDEFNQGVASSGLGYGNSPSNLLFGAGQQYGKNAGMDWDALGALLGPYLAGR